MGRPHARVMLRRSLVQGTVVGLTLRSTSWFVVQATGTDRDGESLRGDLLPVAPGVEFRLRLLDGMTGFLLAAPTSGCQGDAELSLPPFTLDIEVLSRTAETS